MLVTCENCGGKGKTHELPPKRCPECKGIGKRYIEMETDGIFITPVFDESVLQEAKDKMSKSLDATGVVLSGVGYLDKPCERCDDGNRLHCSYPCPKVSHDHECPDCGRRFSVDIIKPWYKRIFN